ncbi:aminopeptidase [Candidatus Woesearchaeota archaeon]|nr:aminopeptidase [Candidatus Woesearchaeota archaeon]
MAIDEAIMNALKVNMGWRPKEKVGIIVQYWHKDLEEETRKIFEKSKELSQKIFRVFMANKVDPTIFFYFPKEARNGVDATEKLYHDVGLDIPYVDLPSIFFMPTAYSLSHTNFRKALTERGVRIASMPGFTLEMFEPGGPMSVDYDEIHRKTEEIGKYLRKSKFVRVNAKNTDMLVAIDPNTVKVSSGILRKQGDFGNLPGAEAYVVPVHEGPTNGIFTVPAGWGGDKPLKYDATFFVKDGRIVKIANLEGKKEAQEYIDKEIKPLVFDEPHRSIVAELGIGTNPAINAEYIKEHGWSLLTAEKIGGSVHFANGSSHGMGGKNESDVHIDWVVPNAKIEYKTIVLIE